MNLIEKIAVDLMLDQSYILRIAERSSFYYRDYTIPKRDGQMRCISQPGPELKTLQYWVLRNILEKLPVSQFACAYKKGASIRKHAQLHKDSQFILHADICNFFPSIKPCLLEPILRSNKKIFDDLSLDLDNSIIDINKICFKNQSLAVGAVSSPAISNSIMYEFDIAISEFCKEKNYIYSRYADDIYISSKNFIDKAVINTLEKELRKYNFTLNFNKTRFLSRKCQRKVTGIIITDNSQISIGTQRKNMIKKAIYDKLVHGKGDSDKILGYLSFLKDIEPISYNNIIIKYSQYCKGDLFEAIKK